MPYSSKSQNVQNQTIQMKATEQYIPVVLFIILYKVDLTFESVDEILKCDHSNESYWAVLKKIIESYSAELSCDTVFYVYSQTFHKQTPLGPSIAVHLWEVSAYGRLKNTKHHRG